MPKTAKNAKYVPHVERGCFTRSCFVVFLLFEKKNVPWFKLPNDVRKPHENSKNGCNLIRKALFSKRVVILLWAKNRELRHCLLNKNNRDAREVRLLKKKWQNDEI